MVGVGAPRRPDQSPPVHGGTARRRRTVPSWVVLAREFSGALVRSYRRARTPGGTSELVVRAAVVTPDGRRVVIADLPVDESIIERVQQQTGARLKQHQRARVRRRVDAAPGPGGPRAPHALQ